MADQVNFRLRAFYEKSGRLALLSHLEVARSLERAIRRAELPYAISQGFSPHMKIAFGAALPVGVGGASECFDLFLTRYIAPEKVLEALQASSAEGLMVHSCSYIGNQEPAASVAFPISTYEAVLSTPLESVEIPEIITVIRKRKEKQLVVSEFLQGDIEIDDVKLVFTLCAKPTGSLRPDVLLQHVLADLPVEVRSVTRVGQSTY